MYVQDGQHRPDHSSIRNVGREVEEGPWKFRGRSERDTSATKDRNRRAGQVQKVTLAGQGREMLVLCRGQRPCPRLQRMQRQEVGPGRSDREQELEKLLIRSRESGSHVRDLIRWPSR